MLIRKLTAIIALMFVGWVAVAVLPAASDPLSYDLKFKVTLDPAREGARVVMTVDKGELLKRINFANQETRISDIKANGKLTKKDGRVFWDLPSGQSTLSYFVKITRERDPGKYDAIINKDWAIFRGDSIIPPIHTDEVPGSYSNSTLEFELPPTWKSVKTGWPRITGNTFRIDNPERLLDRPTGWMIAGHIGSRSTAIKGTTATVAAPIGQRYQRMDALVLLRFIWPEIKKAFIDTPPRVLIVGAGDPMWRGGLSGPNSFFLHADRPLVSENGTSPLVHELTHMVTRISGVTTEQTNDDWIAEGLVEFYSFELIYRAHGISKSRRSKIIRDLGKWGENVAHLRKTKSTGPVTARAVVLLDALNTEIRQRSKNKYSIDDVTRQLMLIRKVSLADLRTATEKLIGPQVDTLDSALLR